MSEYYLSQAIICLLILCAYLAGRQAGSIRKKTQTKKRVLETLSVGHGATIHIVDDEMWQQWKQWDADSKSKA